MDQTTPSRVLTLVGPGRAGTAVALALYRRGWVIGAVAGRAPDAPSTRRAAALLGGPPALPVAGAGAGSDTVIIATPDHAIVAAANAVAPSVERGALIVHLSGAVGLEVFGELRAARPDVRVGALHPLQSLPAPELGAERLAGAWCAVEGSDAVARIAQDAGMQPFRVGEGARARAVYHAAACVASNHLVALLAQVQRLAGVAGAPAEAFLPLVRATVENTAELGPAAALTGPVARGDAATVATHLDAIPDDERDAYRSGASEALRLTGRDDPAMDALVRGVVA